MKIITTASGYVIETNNKEYHDFVTALGDAEYLCNEHASYDEEQTYKVMREELEAEKKCIALIQTGRTGSDETAPFKVTDFWAKTLVEFITEVLEERPHEWGFFQVKTIGGRVEYRDGELLDEIPDSWQYVEPESVEASGGWSRMDYLIKPKLF